VLTRLRSGRVRWKPGTKTTRKDKAMPDTQTCTECDGECTVQCDTCGGENSDDCDTCDGSGIDDCPWCGGTGDEPEEE
jgi:hypothetical protein